MAGEICETEFMKEQELEIGKKFDLKSLEERSHQVNEAFDILKTPKGGQANQQNNLFRSKGRATMISGESSDNVKSREINS